MVGIAAVFGAGVIGFVLAQNAISELNNENANIAARIKAIQASPYSLPSSISSNVAVNCAAMSAMAAIGTLGGTGSAAAIETELNKIKAAADLSTC